jgi:hypothetical protein
MGDADLRLYAYKQFKYPVPNVLESYQKKPHKFKSLFVKFNVARLMVYLLLQSLIRCQY